MNILIIDESTNFDDYYREIEKQFQNKNFLTKVKRFYSLKLAKQKIFIEQEEKCYTNIHFLYTNLVLMDICYPKCQGKRFINGFEFYLKLKENFSDVKCVLFKYNSVIPSSIMVEISKNGDLILQKNKISIEDFTSIITNIFLSRRNN